MFIESRVVYFDDKRYVLLDNSDIRFFLRILLLTLTVIIYGFYFVKIYIADDFDDSVDRKLIQFAMFCAGAMRVPLEDFLVLL